MLLNKICVLIYDTKVDTSNFSIWFDDNDERRIKLGMRSTIISNDLLGEDKKSAVLLQTRTDLGIDLTDKTSIQNSFEVGSIVLNQTNNDDHIKYDLWYYFGLDINLNNNCRLYSTCCVIDKFKHTFSFIPIGSSLVQMRITYYIN